MTPTTTTPTTEAFPISESILELSLCEKLSSTLRLVSFNPLIAYNKVNEWNKTPHELSIDHQIHIGDQISYYEIQRQWPNGARSLSTSRKQVLELGIFSSYIFNFIKINHISSCEKFVTTFIF